MRVAHDGFGVVVNYAGSTVKIDGAVIEINVAGRSPRKRIVISHLTKA